MTSGRHEHFDNLWRDKLSADDPSRQVTGNHRATKALALLSAADTLLDLGCGTGAFGEAASPRFREVHGVDIAADAVHVAQQRGVKAQVVDAGSDPLPYADNAFDAITALSFLQYVVDVEHILRECARVLRPGGQFIVCVPNMRTVWRIWGLAVSGRFPRTSLDRMGVDGGTVHYFTSRSTGDLAARAGFFTVGMYGVFCVPRWFENRADGGQLGWLKREFFSAEVLLDLRAR